MATLLQFALQAARAPMNTLAFHLRSVLPPRRGEPELAQEPLAGVFDYLPPTRRHACEARAAVLVAHYDLGALAGRCPLVTWRECLSVVDGLERLITPSAIEGLGANLRVTDVGAGDWHYVFGLERFWRWRGAASARSVELSGVELDGHVRCRDMRTRAAHARARARQVDGGRVAYRVGDFARAGGRDQDVVTLLYPFVTPYALLAWGLPVYHFKPAALLAAAVGALRPGGFLVALHQTADERERLLALVADQPVVEIRRCSLATDLVHYWDDTNERCAVLLRKLG